MIKTCSSDKRCNLLMDNIYFLFTLSVGHFFVLFIVQLTKSFKLFADFKWSYKAIARRYVGMTGMGSGLLTASILDHSADVNTVHPRVSRPEH